MEEEIIGELSIRSQDNRDVVYAGVVKNMDNIAEDADGFAPVRNYIQTECFEIDTCNRLLSCIFKDIYNQQNNTNIAYDVIIVLVAE